MLRPSQTRTATPPTIHRMQMTRTRGRPPDRGIPPWRRPRPRIPETIALAPTKIASSHSEVSGRVTMKAPSSRTGDADREGCRRRRALDQTERTSQAWPPYRRHTLVGHRGHPKSWPGVAARHVGWLGWTPQHPSASPRRRSRAHRSRCSHAPATGERPGAHPDRRHRPRRRVRRRRRDRPVGRADGDRGRPARIRRCCGPSRSPCALSAAWQLLEGILMRAASDDGPESRASGVGASASGVRRSSSSRWALIAAAVALGARVERGGGGREPRAAGCCAFPGGPSARAGRPRHRHRRHRVHRDGVHGAASATRSTSPSTGIGRAIAGARRWSGSSPRASRWSSSACC